MKRLTLWFLAASAIAGAAPTDRYLYEYARKSYRKAGEELYPNRVYSLFEPELGFWVLAVTDAKGKLAEPREALVPGSVVAGNRIGADPSQRFKLGENGEWAEVKAKEWMWFWVKGGLPLYKWVHEYPPVPRPKRTAKKDKAAKRE